MYRCRICMRADADSCLCSDAGYSFNIDLNRLKREIGRTWYIVEQEAAIKVRLTGLTHSIVEECTAMKQSTYIHAEDDQGGAYTVNTENIGRALFFTQADAAAYIEQKERVRHEPVNQKAILTPRTEGLYIERTIAGKEPIGLKYCSARDYMRGLAEARAGAKGGAEDGGSGGAAEILRSPV